MQLNTGGVYLKLDVIDPWRLPKGYFSSFLMGLVFGLEYIRFPKIIAQYCTRYVKQEYHNN